MYFFLTLAKVGIEILNSGRGRSFRLLSRTILRFPVLLCGVCQIFHRLKKLAELIGHLNGTGGLFHHTPENQTFLIFLKHMLNHPSISHTPVLRWLAVKLTRTEVLIRAFKIGFIWKTCIDHDTARYWKRKTGKIPLPSGIEIHQVLKSISVKCLVIEYTQEASWPQFFGKGVVGCRPDKAERPLMITVAL